MHISRETEATFDSLSRQLIKKKKKSNKNKTRVSFRVNKDLVGIAIGVFYSTHPKVDI